MTVYTKFLTPSNAGSLSREEFLPLKILAGKMASQHHRNAASFHRHQLMRPHHDAGLLKWCITHHLQAGKLNAGK
jgi:hypothetical protein